MKDRVFASDPQTQFQFDSAVASVFDDMLQRSIPYYDETRRLVLEMVRANLQEDDVVYDLGCSTGTMLLELASKEECSQCRLIGVDNAESMLQRARQKAEAYGYGERIVFAQGDILTFPLECAGVIMSNYTLQFIRPIERENLLRTLFETLRPGGLFVMGEKTIADDKWLDRRMIELYLQFKRTQGYSETEIVRKREALENVLVPYSTQENLELLRRIGFAQPEVLFKWVNFTTFIARKAE